MRKLSKKQERLLKEQFEKNGVTSVDELSVDAYFAIYNAYPCEIFWQNANRYLNDLRMEEIRNRDPWKPWEW